MAEAPATERLLRRDRSIVVAAIAAMVLLAGVYTLLGIGMGMSAWEMTTMLGVWPASPGAGMASEMPGGMGGMVMAPAVWTPGYAVLVFLMWWVMMVAMMTSSAAPTIVSDGVDALPTASMCQGSRAETATGESVHE
jgi:predicted metal-binding membrane protein